MEVRVEAANDYSVITPASRLDGLGSKKLRHEAGAPIGAKLPLIVDLGETSAMLASGAEAIYWLAVERRKHGGRTVVVRCNPAAKRLITASGLAAFVAVHPSLADARSAFRSLPGGA